MPDDVDESLLGRLSALRGSSATPERPAASQIHIDVIERAKTPTREEALAARLKRLREQGGASPVSTPARDAPPRDSRHSGHLSARAAAPEEEADAVFETDDQTLEELLGGVDGGVPPPPPPAVVRDDQVKALLDELSRSMPQDDDKAKDGGPVAAGDEAGSDDSDGEQMSRGVYDVLVRFRDEAELDRALAKDEPTDEPRQEAGHGSRDADDRPPEDGGGGVALSSVPSTLADLPSAAPSSTAIDDIAARIAALHAPSAAPAGLPSVPTSAPSARRLTSRTAYTDGDMASWCTVCLDDAALRCLGCDGDPYCARCWREMHRGPAAAFDDRSHRAVQFTGGASGKDKRRVALGAS